MNIDDKTMDYIKKLSKLDIQGAEEAQTRDYLDEAAQYFDKMQEVHIDELSLFTDISENIFREDIPRDFDNKRALLEAAHERYGKYFSIPTVLNGEIKS